MDIYFWLLGIGYNEVVTFSTAVMYYLKLSDFRTSTIVTILQKSKMSSSDFRVIALPIHCTNHWVLGIFDVDKGWYGYYDSNHKIRRWIKHAMEKLVPFLSVNSNNYNLRYCGNISGPKQSNTIDCGLFVLLACRHLAEGGTLGPQSFSQSLMPHCIVVNTKCLFYLSCRRDILSVSTGRGYEISSNTILYNLQSLHFHLQLHYSLHQSSKS